MPALNVFATYKHLSQQFKRVAHFPVEFLAIPTERVCSDRLLMMMCEHDELIPCSTFNQFVAGLSMNKLSAGDEFMA